MIQFQSSNREEIANTLTHAVGVMLSLGALVLLIIFSSLKGNSYHIIGCTIFGTSLLLLYLMSTLYHLASKPRYKKIFRTLDHSSIYILIAGTYTPFTLVNLNGAWGWTLFGLVWGIACLGIAIEIFSRRRIVALSLTLYIGLGWLILIAIQPLFTGVETGGIILLLCGGLVYSLGVLFYVWKSLVFHHAIWHIFVLMGSIFHFFAVFFYVIPFTADDFL